MSHEAQSPFIQHHFDDAKHQFESGKLGIWLFLIQEMLFFSALFVAYVIYRGYHPEIFEYGSKYLDPKMGAINTVVLLISSLTAAWAVRCAQLGQRRGLILCLSLTILCAGCFLGIKYKEYSHKAHIGALFGRNFAPTEAPDGTPLPSAEEIAAMGDNIPADLAAKLPPPKTGMFFSIYFAMTGLHGLHVIIGIGIFTWLLLRARKNHFSPDYIGPVDYAALYWHLVDLIWIFLFPLLYLIH